MHSANALHIHPYGQDDRSLAHTGSFWLGDALDVVIKDLPMTLSTSIAKTLALTPLPRPVMVNIVVFNSFQKDRFLAAASFNDHL